MLEIKKSVTEKGDWGHGGIPYLSAISIINVWCTKINTGVETLFEKGVVCCVLVAKVQFDAIPLFATDCFSQIVTL